MLPTGYTAVTLAQYMRRSIKKMADLFNWHSCAPDGGDYQDAVHAVLREYGVATVEQATIMSLVEALARRAAWRQVLAATTSQYNYATNGESFDRDALFKQANAQLALIEAQVQVELSRVNPAQAAQEAGAGSVGVGHVLYADDPYEYSTANPPRPPILFPRFPAW